jgi:hypothetical protein
VRRRRRSLVETADEQISIIDACRLIGMQVDGLSEYGRGLKVRCPFGDLYH